MSGKGGVAGSGGSGRGDRRGRRFLFVVVEMLLYLSGDDIFHGGFECGAGEVLVEESHRVVGSRWAWGLGGSGMGNSIHVGR